MKVTFVIQRLRRDTNTWHDAHYYGDEAEARGDLKILRETVGVIGPLRLIRRTEEELD